MELARTTRSFMINARPSMLSSGHSTTVANLEVVKILMFIMSTVKYWNRKQIPSLIASSAWTQIVDALCAP
jgi:hypothetical protein